MMTVSWRIRRHLHALTNQQLASAFVGDPVYCDAAFKTDPHAAQRASGFSPDALPRHKPGIH